MIQPYGCDTFEYFALPIRLCTGYVGSSSKPTTSDQLYIPDPIPQKHALSPNFDTVGFQCQKIR